jgi:hypothetical protein
MSILIAKKSSIYSNHDLTSLQLTIGKEYVIKNTYAGLNIYDDTLHSWFFSPHEYDIHYYGKFFYTKKLRDIRLSTLLENNNKMEFTLEELEIIKEALTVSLNVGLPDLEDPEKVIRILDRIDKETQTKLYDYEEKNK